jgi:hypothetical protein
LVREQSTAIEAAAKISEQVRGAENVEAAEAADIIVLAVPYSNHAHILESLRQVASGKIVLDVVVPLVPPKVSVVQLPQEGSAALEAKAILGTLRDGWRFFVRDRDRKRWRGVSVLAPAPLRHLSDS